MLHLSPDRWTTGQFGARPPCSVMSSSRCQRTFRINQKYWALKKVGIQFSWEKRGFLVMPVFSPMARMFCLTLLGNSVRSTLPMATCRATWKRTQSLFSHSPGGGSPIITQPELNLRPVDREETSRPYRAELDKGDGWRQPTQTGRRCQDRRGFAFRSMEWKISSQGLKVCSNDHFRLFALLNLWEIPGLEAFRSEILPLIKLKYKSFKPAHLKGLCGSLERLCCSKFYC